MPTTLHDRERAFEAKFAHDEEFRFLVLARRDKLFAQWGAETLDLPAESADALVKAVLAIPNGPGHDKALMDFITARYAAVGQPVDADLSEVLHRCMKDAQAQLIAHPPGFSGASERLPDQQRSNRPDAAGTIGAAEGLDQHTRLGQRQPIILKGHLHGDP